VDLGFLALINLIDLFCCLIDSGGIVGAVIEYWKYK